jgi:thiol:disulfide interchange protein
MLSVRGCDVKEPGDRTVKIKQFLLAAVMIVAPVAAQESADHPVSVQVVSEYQSVQPGEPIWLGVHLEMEEGWHAYWKNPGEAGLAPQLDWELPEGFEVADVQWPHPKRFEQSGLIGYGYEESLTLLAKVTTPEMIEVDAIEIGLSTRWVVCKDSCVPGSDQQKISIPVLAQAPKADPQHVELFATARTHIPATSQSVGASHEGDRVVLNIETQSDVKSAYFFPDPGLDGVFDYSAAQEVTKTATGVTLAVPSENEVDPSLSLSGVLVLMGEQEVLASFQINTPLGFDMPGPTEGIEAAGGMSFGLILLLAFGGGLILNVMPCVLPVISLKILSFVNMSGSSRKKLFQHGLLFTLGVVVSFWIIAAALLILRALGEGVGWGFQLQNPLFVLILAVVMFALGLSLLGVFEFGTSLSSLGGQVSGKKGRMATFFSGVLATVVATPCTGPLLAPALGVAVTLPPAASLLTFTVMGIGMSAPYLLLAAFPKLVNKLPKPGPWMVVFKQLMGFIMLATVLWLLWVFDAQVQSGLGLIKVLGALLIVGIGAWVFGRWGTALVKRSRRYVAYAVTLLLIAFAGVIGYQASEAEPTQIVRAATEESGWEEWDPDRFDELRAQGTPVFVDFTAKWCMICQANKVPMGNSAVLAAFKERGVVMMEADWTKRDARITEELAKHGRNGVPLYLLYVGGPDTKPIVLPQMLSPGKLINALN